MRALPSRHVSQERTKHSICYLHRTLYRSVSCLIPNVDSGKSEREVLGCSQDLSLIEVTLGNSRSRYLPASINPIGAISLRKLSPGELIPVTGLASAGDVEQNEEISLSLRSVDIPTQVTPGSVVNIYQVHDEENGAPALEPFEVIHGAHVSSLDRKGTNFGGEVALTIATSSRYVERLLAASTSGRLVAVLSYE
jgi:hypothetical protein